MNSVWSNTVELSGREPLKGNVHTEVLIIGGGMAGILCALRLQQAEVPYILVEAKELCSGVTRNTTAKITSQHGLVYDSILSRFGVECARIYSEANEAALDEYRKLCVDIDCDFEEKDAIVYSLDNRRKIERELEALDRIGHPAEFMSELPLPFSVAGAVKFRKQAQFNPLKFVKAAAQDLNIYEHTKVTGLADHRAVTNSGIITADKIIVATHFPILNKHGSYFLKQYQHRSYVIALRNAPDVGAMYVDESDKGMSFRNYQDLLLIGGGGSRTGKQGGKWQELREFAREHYPDAREKYCWATQDCMTLDRIPYIGQYSARTPDLYVATGFNKWGMTTSMVAAMILTDAVRGVANPWAETFSPSRSILRPQLAVNAFEATVNLLRPAKRRCPHLGCALKWNPEERSWDCECHGSRFAEDGQLIDNPATDDLFPKGNRI